jgi:predicted ABC-type ATPase
VLQGGHDVPEIKIRERYERSLELLYGAAELAYQCYFFDNSRSDVERKFEPFAHFKVLQGRKVWDPIKIEQVPEWFDSYYLQKMPAG